VVEGKSNKEIADQLFISESRVKTQITQILERFNLKDRTQLAVYALRNNLID
jgi:DNA-binding NarL/FixJ family response regulator